ncbi:Anti-sigma-K factor RskA [Variovorax sp. YR750]|uniref:anti-sigma factor n=1 Tax=Variovorax sp. YR750 TaxID=1884384 RepID=UPI0008D893C2|nr:anti-sigma factor [Variovorax sp. YR750]SEL44987.1 Anti-sigma-K factor RskA [Variovorax sp. YR750]
MRYTDPRLLDALASSYALGTLAGGARRRFERLMRDRADVRDVVAHWEQRLGQLALSVPQRKPSPDLWRAIAARTQPVSTSERAPAKARASRWTSWLRPAGFGVGGLAAGVIAASALFLAVPGIFITSDQLAMRSGERLPQSYVGVLTDTEGRGRLLVSSLRYGRTVTLKVLGGAALPVSGEERLVLWALPADAAPFAIGTVPTSGAGTLALPDTSEKLLSKVSRLIVTRERNASPAAPSADVVLSGACAKLW